MAILRGIVINDEIHTGQDLDLVMESKNIGSPEVQSNTVEIPGRNGRLDMSEFMTGEPTYNNRELSFEFLASGSREVILESINNMMSYHGQYITLVIDDIENWYYEGRASVTYADNGYRASINLSVDAQPFRYAIEPTSYSYSNISNQEITLNNRGVSVIPKIVVDSETTIVFNEFTYQISAGTYEADELILAKGDNVFTVTTGGSISIEYREAMI